MMGDDASLPTWVLVLGASILWPLYFVLAYSPLGSVFVYATF